MTRTLLAIAASLLIAPATWAMDAPIQPGGGNNVSSQFKTTPAPAPAPAAIPDHNGPINAPIQPGGGNNVNAQFQSTPAPAPAPAATPAADTNVSHAPFNASSYRTASDCMTAASAAHQPLAPCEGLKK
jgi:hypothetical protein